METYSLLVLGMHLRTELLALMVVVGLNSGRAGRLVSGATMPFFSPTGIV